MKRFPLGKFHVGQIGTVTRILDAKGRDVMMMEGGPERLVECCNALSTIFFPETHVPETEAYVKRLEALRRAAWDRAKQLEAELASLRSPTPSEERAA